MLKKMLMLAAIFILGVAGNSFAQVYEGFNYPANVLVTGQNGGTGWNGGWQTYYSNPGYEKIKPSGLTYPGLTVTGNALDSSTSSRKFAPIIGSPGTSVRIACLYQRNSGSSELYVSLGVPFGTAGLLTRYITFGRDMSDTKFSISNVITNKIDNGNPTYLVVQIDFQNGNDRIRFWVNPPATANLATAVLPTTADADFTSIDIPQISVIELANRNGTIDEINIVKVSNCVQPPSQMTSWWTFDETSGTIANNKITAASNGSHINNPTFVTGKVAGALSFNGTTNYVQAPSFNGGNFGTGDFTIDAWVKINPASPKTVMTIVDKRMLVGGLFFKGFSFFIQQKNTLGLIMGGGIPSFSNGPPGFTLWTSPVINLTDNNWHHVAVTVTRNANNGIVWYYDGNQIGTANPLSRKGNLSNTSPVYIGYSSVSVPVAQAFFDGAIDELELFNRALTATEIQSIYNAQSDGKCK